MAPTESSSANRIEALLQQLGLERVHVAACMSGDWGELVTKHADCIHSLTVVAPHLNKGIPDGLNAFQSPAMVIAGDQGASARRAHDLAARFGNGELFELSDYSSPMWADTIADRTVDVSTRIFNNFQQPLMCLFSVAGLSIHARTKIGYSRRS